MGKVLNKHLQADLRRLRWALSKESMEDLAQYTEIVKSFLSKWEKNLSGCNYVVEFGFKLILHKGEKLRKEEALYKLMCLSSISDIEFTKCNEHEMKSNISNLLRTGGFETQPSHFTKEIVKDINNKMLPKYYEHIKHYINLGSSNIYKLTNVPDAPCFDIFWSYTYLVTDHNRGTSIIIWGGASD